MVVRARGGHPGRKLSAPSSGAQVQKPPGRTARAAYRTCFCIVHQCAHPVHTRVHVHLSEPKCAQDKIMVCSSVHSTYSLCALRCSGAPGDLHGVLQIKFIAAAYFAVSVLFAPVAWWGLWGGVFLKLGRRRLGMA